MAGLWGGWWISLLCQIACQCSMVLLVVPILCPWHCMILSFQLPNFWCECSVHHAQYGQFNILASISSPTFLAVCSWSQPYHLSWMMVLLCLFCGTPFWLSFMNVCETMAMGNSVPSCSWESYASHASPDASV